MAQVTNINNSLSLPREVSPWLCQGGRAWGGIKGGGRETNCALPPPPLPLPTNRGRGILTNSFGITSKQAAAEAQLFAREQLQILVSLLFRPREKT